MNVCSAHSEAAVQARLKYSVNLSEFTYSTVPRLS